jgi:hypothetical protein
MRSAIGALALGMAGQVTFHLLSAAGATVAPWPVTVAVSCMPVAVLGFAAALAHLLRADGTVQPEGVTDPSPGPVFRTVSSSGLKAAKKRLQFALENDFKISNEELQNKFSLTRAQATKIRAEVIADVAGRDVFKEPRVPAGRPDVGGAGVAAAAGPAHMNGDGRARG